MSTLATAAALSARTTRVRVDDVLDALGPASCAWLHDDLAIATEGVAALVDPADACATLRAIPHRAPRGIDHPAAGPLAIGALRFTGGGLLTVPARITVRAGNEAWQTTIEGSPAAVASLDPTRGRAGRPGRDGRHARRFVVEATQDLGTWDAMVTAGLSLVAARKLRKLVLAREVTVEADAPFEVATVLDRLRATQPACFVYADDHFVGASPELLVRRRGTQVQSRPMAGSVPRAAGLDADAAATAALVASAKNNSEHALVVDMVRQVLDGRCDDVTVHATEAVPLATVTHLTTSVTGTLRDLGVSALDLALALHPTPAVGGTPTAAALEAIARIEGFDRGCYGAPVGWVNGAGDGEFAVALRCAELNGTRARLLAGAGIVAGSDPDLEWVETQAKLEPMLRALVRP